jgi:hypothetical protein
MEIFNIQLTGKVQVAHTKLGTSNMHRQIHLAAPAQVLDITVAAMLRSSRNRPGALLSHFFLDSGVCASGVHTRLEGRKGDVTVELIGGNELPLTLVPCGEDFGRRGAAKDTGVDEAGELDVGDVARRAVDAFKVPNGFCSGITVSKILFILVDRQRGEGEGEGTALTPMGTSHPRNHRRSSCQRCR